MSIKKIGLKWEMNPEYIGNPLKINWLDLAVTFKTSLKKLNRDLNNGAIFVFNGLDAICEFYTECELDTESIDLLKNDIKEGSVIYTQHLFFMIA